MKKKDKEHSYTDDIVYCVLGAAGTAAEKHRPGRWLMLGAGAVRLGYVRGDIHFLGLHYIGTEVQGKQAFSRIRSLAARSFMGLARSNRLDFDVKHGTRLTAYVHLPRRPSEKLAEVEFRYCGANKEVPDDVKTRAFTWLRFPQGQEKRFVLPDPAITVATTLLEDSPLPGSALMAASELWKGATSVTPETMHRAAALLKLKRPEVRKRLKTLATATWYEGREQKAQDKMRKHITKLAEGV